ncbi:uncharacterized protein (DUF2141 family) [Aliiruegeria haliotis]|uniref:Uncharacterized protein (DUF2141 family) n=1 Tax=Aliiruegeria haliotis TaxID=1280846 RepID=A0A2T0REL6_9RHOB|nr:DUF2141 domain-containing protein [Aliiruegeria haliotis]PRY19603.1 uncharacterized protein (DUF2141 family) [Aliiruegeria haliotis]
MLRPILLTAAIVAGLAAETHAADLDITISGATPAAGQILLSVFDAADNWMQTPVASRTIAITGPGIATASFDLTPGRYGIAVIHDANGNGVLDTGSLRIPIEAFAFSNGARARFGPPAFDRAAFTLPPDGLSLRIPLTNAN